MQRIGLLGGIVLCVTAATACAALDVVSPAPPVKIIRRLPPVEPRSTIFSIEEIAAANEQQLKFEESFGHVLEVTKGIPDSPTFGGWIDVGYNSGSTGWSMDY